MSLRLLPSYSSCIMLVWVLGPEESDGEEEGKEDRDKDHVHVEVSRSASQSVSQAGCGQNPKNLGCLGGNFGYAHRRSGHSCLRQHGGQNTKSARLMTKPPVKMIQREL